MYVENRAAAWIKLSVSTLSMYPQIAPRGEPSPEPSCRPSAAAGSALQRNGATAREVCYGPGVRIVDWRA
jgi:hypothetical protein